jgi:hypothetical protein
VIDVGETTLTEVAATPPTVTVASEVKFVPVTVTWMPPVRDASSGETEVTVGGATDVTVVTADPVWPGSLVRHTLNELLPAVKADAGTVVITEEGDVEYVPLAPCVPELQSLPPTRTEYVPFSSADHVTTVDGVDVVSVEGFTEDIVTNGVGARPQAWATETGSVTVTEGDIPVSA